MPTIQMWRICKQRGHLWRRGTWFAWCTKNPLRRRNPLPASSDSSLLFLQTCGCTWSTPAWFSPCEEQKAALLQRMTWTLFYAVNTCHKCFFFMQNLELVNIWMASNLAGSENQSSQECVSCFLWSWASTRLKWVSGTDYVLFIRIIWVKSIQEYLNFIHSSLWKNLSGCFWKLISNKQNKYINFWSTYINLKG